MALTKAQKKIVRDAVIVIDEQRMRLTEELSVHVTDSIELRKIIEILENTRNELAPLIKSKKKFIEVAKEGILNGK